MTTIFYVWNFVAQKDEAGLRELEAALRACLEQHGITECAVAKDDMTAFAPAVATA